MRASVGPMDPRGSRFELARWPARVCRALLLLALGGLLLDGCRQHLTLGRPMTAPAPRERPDLYSVHLPRGAYLAVATVLDRAELTIRFRDPKGRLIFDFDSQQKPGATERIEWLAEEEGEYEIELAPLPTPKPGGYSIELEHLRSANATDRQRAAAFQHVARARSRLEKTQPQAALAELDRALQLWQSLGDRNEQASVLALRGIAYSLVPDNPKRLQALDWALSLARGLPDRELEANVHEWRADALNALSQRDAALEEYGRAIALYRTLGRPSREAACWEQKGRLYLLSREVEQAQKYFQYGSDLYRKAGDQEGRITSLRWLANISLSLGQSEEALAAFRQAAKILESLGQRVESRPQIVLGEGDVYAWSGDVQKARFYLREAALLARAQGDKATEAVAFNRLGNVEFDVGNYAEAESLYQSSYELALQTSRHSDIVYALSNLGRCSLQRGLYLEARERFAKSRAIYDQTEDRSSQADQRIYLARAEMGLGHFATASALIDDAGHILETARRSSTDPGIRSAAFGVMQSLYRARMALFMELDARDPGGRWATRAFEAAEESRARTLVDEVVETASEPAARDRRNSSTVPEIQRSLLGPDTVLLAYRLDHEKSFLWLLTDRQLLSFPLPARKEIEAQVDVVLKDWTGDSSALKTEETRRAALENEGKLSQTLLGPLAGRLAGKRLLIVSDGVLQKVPFIALFEPGTNDRLLDHHEVIHLPSASFAVELRRKLQGRRKPPENIAILAPIFDPGDVTAPREGGHRWGRLGYSEKEATQIYDLFPDREHSFLALHGAANLALATSGRLSRFRILHFATHGHLDSKNPKESGLALFGEDPRGRRTFGLLSAGQIYEMSLPADLVVLSACKTGLGKSIEGEGLLALPRAFFHAGAAQVMMSLWDVNDISTAQLMQDFYRGITQDRLSAAAALRQAQLEVRRQYSSPYHWAGFVLQGEDLGLLAQQNEPAGVL